MSEHTMPKPWTVEYHEGAGGSRYARVLSPTGYILLSMIPIQGLDEDYLREMLRAVNAHEALVAALRISEWAAGPATAGYCPYCNHFKRNGHGEGCQLAAALRAAEPADEREKGEG